MLPNARRGAGGGTLRRRRSRDEAEAAELEAELERLRLSTREIVDQSEEEATALREQCSHHQAINTQLETEIASHQGLTERWRSQCLEMEKKLQFRQEQIIMTQECDTTRGRAGLAHNDQYKSDHDKDQHTNVGNDGDEYSDRRGLLAIATSASNSTRSIQSIWKNSARAFSSLTSLETLKEPKTPSNFTAERIFREEEDEAFISSSQQQVVGTPKKLPPTSTTTRDHATRQKQEIKRLKQDLISRERVIDDLESSVNVHINESHTKEQEMEQLKQRHRIKEMDLIKRAKAKERNKVELIQSMKQKCIDDAMVIKRYKKSCSKYHHYIEELVQELEILLLVLRKVEEEYNISAGDDV